ncbi:hypothetical protein FHETE_11244 [Fusarium heterosporum]|uniref:Stc1 domain-containing protein n=1 Tax=Fusarium heterosporum TaxID=42747 RepID=A0A8H5SK41_FUSHE|nr:hypothetical protein FHETE_11244 [Fusarium heterosporum]
MYRCAAGGEMKPLSAYSTNQQRRAKRNNHQSSGMICNEHSQSPGLERYCHVCNQTLPIHKFSRNSRNDDEPRCIRCTAWDTDAEHNVTPLPLATGHVSIEEQLATRWKEPTSTAEFFDEEDFPEVPISGPEALNLQPSKSVNKIFTQLVGDSRSARTMQTASEASSVAGEQLPTTSKPVPPHLRSRLRDQMRTLTVDDQSVGSSNMQPASVGGTSSRLPPHLLQKQKEKENGKQQQGSITGSISTATTVRDEKATTNRQIQYSGWDNEGKKHQVIKNPTVMSDSASAMSTNDNKSDSNIIGEWDNIATAPEPELRKSKWPKSSELRISAAGVREKERLQEERQKYEPDTDTQRRRNYNNKK